MVIVAMKGCCSYMKRVDHLTYRDPYSGINWWALVVLALVSHNLRFNEPSPGLTQENCEPCVTVPGDPSDHLVGTYK